MSFSTDLLKSIGPALAELHFYDAPKWGRFSHQIIFTRAVDDELAAYLHCRNPHGTENIRLQFWVAPLDIADDATFEMQTGGCVTVLEATPPWQHLLGDAVKRVSELIEQIPAMAAGVRQELIAPIEDSIRLPIYLASRRLFRRAPGLMPAEVWAELEAVALNRIRGKILHPKFDEAIQDATEQYLAEAAFEEMPHKKLPTAARTFGKHLLAHALLRHHKTLSEAQARKSA